MVPSRLFRRRYTQPGAPPGALVLPEERIKPSIRVMSYSVDRLDEQTIEDVTELPGFLRDGYVTWVDVQGLGDEPTLRALAEMFSLHQLTLADIVNVGARPRAEEFDRYLFMITRMVLLDAQGDMSWEQVSILIGDRWALTFQERPGDCLDALRVRVRRGRPQLREAGPDYLGMMALDAIIDGYFPVLERFGERLETSEEDILERADPEALATIFRTKRDLATFRRAIWPQREFLSAFTRERPAIIAESTTPFVRDTQEHAIHVADVTDSYRDVAQSLVDLHISMTANRTNEVMRVLTVIATIFIPLTFLAGIYGMNFDPEASRFNMPELGWRYGYLAFWAVALIVAGVMLVVARRQGWLGGRRRLKE